MADKMNEMLTDDELDSVVGGGSYTMLTYKQQEDGHYSFKVTRFDGDEASWKSFCSGTPASSLDVKISTASGGVSGAKWDAWLARQQKRYGEGLVIKAM